MNNRTVTERDLRMPEFRDADPKDLEFRDDGKLVRKDRWETGMRKVASAVGLPMHGDVEIYQVVDAVVEMAEGVQQAIGDDLWRWLKQ
jgi:hypothetical protein